MQFEPVNASYGRRIFLLVAFGVLILMLAAALPGYHEIPASFLIAWLAPLMAVMWIVFWLVQFVNLMASPSHRFMGPYDKLIWAAVFIFLLPLAPVAFWLWKQAIKPHHA